MPKKSFRHFVQHQEIPETEKGETMRHGKEKESSSAKAKLGDMIVVGVKDPTDPENPIFLPAIVVKVMNDTQVGAIVFAGGDDINKLGAIVPAYATWISGIEHDAGETEEEKTERAEKEGKEVKDLKELVKPRAGRFVQLSEAPEIPTEKEKQEKAEKERTEKKIKDLEKELENAKKQKPAPDAEKVTELETEIDKLKKSLEPEKEEVPA